MTTALYILRAFFILSTTPSISSEFTTVATIFLVVYANFNGPGGLFEIIKKSQKRHAFMKENKEYITINDEKEYQLITVKLHGQGIFFRKSMYGKRIKTKKQKVVKAGQFIVAEVDAKYGAFGVIPRELEGAIVSSHYWLFDLDEEKILPKQEQEKIVKELNNQQEIKNNAQQAFDSLINESIIKPC